MDKKQIIEIIKNIHKKVPEGGIISAAYINSANKYESPLSINGIKCIIITKTSSTKDVMINIKPTTCWNLRTFSCSIFIPLNLLKKQVNF